MHAALGPRDLVGERRLGGRQRIGVGHLEYGGDAAEHGRARARLEILLVDRTGLAKMHLAVDHARQDVQSGAIDTLAGAGRAQIADFGDAAVAHADIARAGSVLVDHAFPSIERGRTSGAWRGPCVAVACANRNAA